MSENHASTRADRVALSGTAVLVVSATIVAIAASRGPLSTEHVARAVQWLPRIAWLLVATVLAAPAVGLAFREKRRPIERAAAAFALLAAWALAWRVTAEPPRSSFDGWERALSSTAVGIPWWALVALVAASGLAASFALSIRRVLLARGDADTSRLRVVLGACAALALAFPASAIVQLSTGTRVLPVGEPDDPWAPAFVGSACPPPRAAPSAASSSASPSASAPRP